MNRRGKGTNSQPLENSVLLDTFSHTSSREIVEENLKIHRLVKSLPSLIQRKILYLPEETLVERLVNRIKCAQQQISSYIKYLAFSIPYKMFKRFEKKIIIRQLS